MLGFFHLRLNGIKIEWIFDLVCDSVTKLYFCMVIESDHNFLWLFMVFFTVQSQQCLLIAESNKSELFVLDFFIGLWHFICFVIYGYFFDCAYYPFLLFLLILFNIWWPSLQSLSSGHFSEIWFMHSFFYDIRFICSNWFLAFSFPNFIHKLRLFHPLNIEIITK